MSAMLRPGRPPFCHALLASCALLLTLIPAGCRQEQPGSDGQTGRAEKVVVVGSSWYGHLPVWVGIERGTFKEHGFEVEWRVVGKSMDRLNAISGGTAHFASLGEIAMLGAMAQGNDRFYWVGNQDIAPGFEGLVAREGIASFEDLRGKRIGFPFASSVDLTCRLLLAQNGLDPETDVQLVNLEVGDVPAAFRNGSVDAALVWEPGFSQLQEVEGATVLGRDTDTDIYEQFATMTGPDVLILNKAWADEDRDRTRRFMAAYFQSLAWVKENPEAAVHLVLGKYIQQDRDLVLKNLRLFVWHTLEDQRRVMTDEGIFGQAAEVSRLLHEDLGTIPRQPDFRQWVDLELLPEELPSGG